MGAPGAFRAEAHVDVVFEGRLQRHPVYAISRIVTGEKHPGGSTDSAREPLDVILDTDIGTDIDDAYALLLAISSSELNVKGVTLVHGDVGLRAKIAQKLLKLSGHAGIPVAVGGEHPINRDRPIYWAGHEGRGIDFSDVEKMRVADESAAEFIARSVVEDGRRLTLITIGAMTNAAIAVRDFPREMAALERIVSMGSTFRGYGHENAGVEHNIKCDPEAAAIVLNSGIPVTLVGLNVTTKTALTRRHLAQISGFQTPLAQLMVHMTRDWLVFRGRGSTPMHDPLAVAAAFDPGVVGTIPVSANVSREVPGQVAYCEANAGSPLEVCRSVNVPRFEDAFFSRVLPAVERQQGLSRG